MGFYLEATLDSLGRSRLIRPMGWGLRPQRHSQMTEDVASLLSRRWTLLPREESLSLERAGFGPGPYSPAVLRERRGKGFEVPRLQ